MNGAQALVGTMHAAGVRACFANPGTSELQIVEALSRSKGVRAVLCLFEGVATGAADGFGRMSDVPAAALLHQGAGLANGLANLHNAKRAHTPVVVVVGDGATSHAGLGSPLESDVEALARPMSCWVRTGADPGALGRDVAAAVAAARQAPGGVATLVVPSDVADGPGGRVTPAMPVRGYTELPEERVSHTARTLSAGREAVTVLLGGPALRATGLATAARIAGATGARLFCEAFPSRLECGAGVPPIQRLAGDPVRARQQLAGTRTLVLAGASRPVAAFAQPGGVSGVLAPPRCEILVLAGADEDVVGALAGLADRVAPEPPGRVRSDRARAAFPSDGVLTAELVAGAVAAALPDAAIVVDETNSCGPPFASALARGPRHDLLTLTGFAIGQGLPLSVGAALACPGRRVVCLEADGSAMYTLSGLWTQAREGLDITTIMLNNRAYAILRREAARVLGADTDLPSSPLFDLSRPPIDFTSIAAGMGLPGGRARTVRELTDHLRRAFAEPGPYVIDAHLPT
ncbi:MAG TPA: acetolactate synthase large subunit [Kribbellaceae bacterium]|nr:acetolactate synthase large subunit [Kribbellaceae bacterium]